MPIVFIGIMYFPTPLDHSAKVFFWAVLVS
jgi:hypothetical protein